jgi:hypothetical protein
MSERRLIMAARGYEIERDRGRLEGCGCRHR